MPDIDIERKDIPEQSEQQAQNTEGQEQANTAEQDADNGLPKTQEELDALIEKRLARERKRLIKQQANTSSTAAAAQPPAAGTELPPAAVSTDNSATAEIQRELVSARAQLEAIRSGIRPELTEDAVALALIAIEKDGDEPGQETIQEALNSRPKATP